MNQFYQGFGNLQLLLLLGASIFMLQTGMAQSNSVLPVLDALNQFSTQKKRYSIRIANETGQNETFHIYLRQQFQGSKQRIKNWFGHSINSKERTIHLTHWAKGLRGSINDGTRIHRLVFQNGYYSWSPSQSEDGNSSHTSCILSKSKSGKGITGKSLPNADLLTYRLALTSTPQFSAIHGNNVTEVLAALMNYVNQINTIYERELGIRLMLAEESEKLIFLGGENDPFSTQIGVAILEHVAILNDSLGIHNYDIGHLLKVGGGGLANIEVACTPNKGFGSSGFEDASNFYLLMAHEIGHQIGAGHTWNSCSSSLNQLQRSPSSAMEPGSGTTIMSYAGLCGANNSANDRDPYFHVISIEQIRQYTRAGIGATCAQVENEPNSPPIITASSPSEKSIPKGTPFKLSGKAFDNEGDIITHGWDQVDQGTAVNLGIESQYNPIIRSKSPTTQGVRHIPDLVNLANNIDDKSEILPLTQRSLEFRYVVRDNHTGNGNIAWSNFTLQIDSSAGPFSIMDHSAQWIATGIHPVKWDIANTDNNTVDCQLVNILIDYEGLLEFKDTLARNVPNDGLHYVELPDTATSNARLMIMAADNIFFDISDAPFTIQRTSSPDFQTYTDTTSIEICDESSISYTINSISFNSFDNPIRYSVGPLKNGLNASFSENDILPGNTTRLDIQVDGALDRKTYDIPVNAFAANGSIQTINYTLRLIENDLTPVQLIKPNPAELIETGKHTFSWTQDPSADKYIFELATNPSFQLGSILYKDSTSANHILSSTLSAGVYFWRILSKNECSTALYSNIQSFGIKNTTCTSYSNTNIFDITEVVDSISSSINITEDFPIASLALSNINGTHSYVGDLQFILIAPDGQRFKLIQNECNESKDFDFDIDNNSDRLRCSINRGLAYRPIDNFDSITGMSAQGEWTLRVVDNAPGDGGNLSGWELNVCTLDNPSNPIKIATDTLKLTPNIQKAITTSILNYLDSDNAPSEIDYIITSDVNKGILILGSDTLHVGDRFAQSDINSSILKYQHSNIIEEQDDFSFVVTDGEGFTTEIQTLTISIKNNVSTRSIEEVFGINIYPNPARNFLLLENPTKLNKDLTARLFHINGKQVMSRKINTNNSISRLDLSTLPKGSYILHLTSEKAVGFKKLIIQ